MRQDQANIFRVAALILALTCGEGCKRNEDEEFARAARDIEQSRTSAAEVEAQSLAAEFEAETDEARRVEIVSSLAINGSLPAQNTLARIYRSAEPALKTALVEALALIDTDDISPAVSILEDAIRNDRTEELRDAAVDTLRDLQHPATLPLWQSLLRDPSPERREEARAAIEYLAPP